MNSYPSHPSVTPATAAHPHYIPIRHPFPSPISTIPPYPLLPYPPHPQHHPQMYYNRQQRFPPVLPPHPMFPYASRPPHHPNPTSINLQTYDSNNGYQHSSSSSPQSNWTPYSQVSSQDHHHPVSTSYPLPRPSSSSFKEYKQIHNSFHPKGVDSNGETTPYNDKNNHYSSVHDNIDTLSHSVQVLPVRDNAYDISTSVGSNIESMRSLNGTTTLLKRDRTDDEVDDDDDDGIGYIETFKKSCDHCIKLKKKCIKYVEEDKCEICLKRNIDCIYSKQRKRGRLPMLADSSKKLVLHPAPSTNSSQYSDTKRSFNTNKMRKKRSESSIKDDANSSNNNSNSLVDQN